MNTIGVRAVRINQSPVKPPEHNGFGTMLLERALEGGQGAAHLDFDPKGLICILELAL